MTERMNVLQRLNKVQELVSYIQKEEKKGMRYAIVSHDAVTASVRPHLVAHGVLYYPVAMSRSQAGNRVEMDLTVRFVAIDDKTDYIDVVTCGYGVDDSDKGPGKAISYSVKYALLKALGLETGDDPDNDQNTQHKPNAQPPASSTIRNPVADAASESWEAWAKSDAAKAWFADARRDLAAMAMTEDVGLWQRANRKQLDALDSYATDRHTKIMDLVNERLDALRAKAPTNLRAAG